MKRKQDPPSGRTAAVARVREPARQQTPAALEKLAAIMRDERGL